MSWTCPKNVSIKSCFMDTLLRRGHGLDMKIADKRPKRRSAGEGKDKWVCRFATGFPQTKAQIDPPGN